MRYFLDCIRLSWIGGAAAIALMGQAHALLILPTYDSTLTGSANAAALEAAVNTATSTINGLYSNPGTVQVLFAFNSGVLGQSQDGESFVSYPQYIARLAANAAAHPSNTVLATAVANLGHGNTGTFVLGTTAFLRVGMGFTGAATTPCYNASGNFVSGCNAIFDGIVTIGNLSTAPAGAGQNSQAVSVLEHELNEVLGGGGTGTTLGDDLSGFLNAGETAIGPTDLYRYRASGATCATVTGTPSYTTDPSAIACYSYDGGSTSLVQMNQDHTSNADYGDFANVAVNIQDAFYPGTTAVYSPLSPEFQMLESISYDAPEPSTIALLVGAVGGLGWVRRRRARRA